MKRMIRKVSFVMLLSCLLVACSENQRAEKSSVMGVYEAQSTGSARGAQAQQPQRKAGKKVVKMEIPAQLSDRPEQILMRRAYTVSYNRNTRNPNWVAWHLTKAHTYGRFQRDEEAFQEDVTVDSPRATTQDYYNSRYDRGHMCPAGDNKWDAQAMTQSFLLTNICPQNHGLNKYEWNDLEILCRDWARKYGAIDIVCGPIYNSKTPQRTIGSNRVWVPDAFFKVVLCREGTPKAIAFIYRNEGRKQPMDHAIRTVDEVERLTGMDFFHALPDEMEKKVEAEADLGKW